MGKPTVNLIHRPWDFYSAQVDADMEEAQIALMRWFAGDASATPPTMPDAVQLLSLMQERWGKEEDWDRDDYDAWAEIVQTRQHRAAINPAASTVGQLIERLQGLDPELAISLVVGDEEGHIDVIEVPPAA